MLFTLFSGCADLSKKAQTGFPTFPKQLNLLYCFAFTCCHFTIPKQKTWGKKKKFIAFQLFFYMKMEQLQLYQEMLLLLNVSHFHCITIKSSLPKNPDFFLGAHRKRRTLLQQVALSKATFT